MTKRSGIKPKTWNWQSESVWRKVEKRINRHHASRSLTSKGSTDEAYRVAYAKYNKAGKVHSYWFKVGDEFRQVQASLVKKLNLPLVPKP